MFKAAVVKSLAYCECKGNILQFQSFLVLSEKVAVWDCIWVDFKGLPNSISFFYDVGESLVIHSQFIVALPMCYLSTGSPLTPQQACHLQSY